MMSNRKVLLLLYYYYYFHCMTEYFVRFIYFLQRELVSSSLRILSSSRTAALHGWMVEHRPLNKILVKGQSWGILSSRFPELGRTTRTTSRTSTFVKLTATQSPSRWRMSMRYGRGTRGRWRGCLPLAIPWHLLRLHRRYVRAVLFAARTSQ